MKNIHRYLSIRKEMLNPSRIEELDGLVEELDKAWYRLTIEEKVRVNSVINQYCHLDGHFNIDNVLAISE